jgi:hypothetical protein
MKPSVYSKERPCAVVIEGLDGRSFAGASVREAVDRMRAAAWGCPGKKTTDAYMRSVAERVMAWNKSHVRVDSLENFVSDLEAAGIVTVRLVQ